MTYTFVILLVILLPFIIGWGFGNKHDHKPEYNKVDDT